MQAYLWMKEQHCVIWLQSVVRRPAYVRQTMSQSIGFYPDGRTSKKRISGVDLSCPMKARSTMEEFMRSTYQKYGQW